MQVQLILTGTNPEQLAKLQSVLGTLAAKGAAEALEAPAPRTRSPKKKANETFELSSDDAANGGDEDEESLDEMDAEEQAETEEEVTEEAEDETPPLKLADVIKAAGKNAKTKKRALAQLAKLKLKTIQKLKPSQFESFVDALDA